LQFEKQTLHTCFKSSIISNKVGTRLDPGDEKAMEDLPENIGDWRILDMIIKGYKEEELERQLNADIITVKGYLKNDPFALPVKLLTLQSKTRASFHPPEVCYPAMGYKILEEGYEDVVIPVDIWSGIEETVDNLGIYSTGNQEINNTIRTLFPRLMIGGLNAGLLFSISIWVIVQHSYT